MSISGLENQGSVADGFQLNWVLQDEGEEGACLEENSRKAVEVVRTGVHRSREMKRRAR